MFLNLFLVSFIVYDRLTRNYNFKIDHVTIYKTWLSLHIVTLLFFFIYVNVLLRILSYLLFSNL